MWSSRPYTFDRVVRIFFSAIMVCVILYFVYILRSVLSPFFVAGIIAYMIEPWVRWNQRHLKIRNATCAVLLTVVEVTIIVGALCCILVPLADREITGLELMLHKYMIHDHAELTSFPATIHHFIRTHLDINSLMADIERINISDAADSIWRMLTSGLDKILGLLGWLIVLVYIVFILLDFDKYKNGVKRLIPNKYQQPVGEVTHDVSWTMRMYFRNQALISFIVGILYMIGFSIVGIPMAVIIGCCCMILFMVPYMVYLTIIPVILMCLFHSMDTGINFWLILLECAAVYVVIEVFNDIYLTPKILGKALGLNAAIVLLAIFCWGSLLGIIGMILALPLTTILIKWTTLAITSWRDKVNGEG